MKLNEPLFALIDKHGVIYEGRIFPTKDSAIGFHSRLTSTFRPHYAVAPVRIIHDVAVPPTNFYDPNETAVR